MTWLNSDDKFHPNAFFTVAGVFMLRNDVEWITGRLNILNEQTEAGNLAHMYVCAGHHGKEFFKIGDKPASNLGTAGALF